MSAAGTARARVVEWPPEKPRQSWLTELWSDGNWHSPIEESDASRAIKFAVLCFQDMKRQDEESVNEWLRLQLGMEERNKP